MKHRLFRAILAPLTSSFHAMFESHHGRCADAMAMIREEYLVTAVSEKMDFVKELFTLLKINAIADL